MIVFVSVIVSDVSRNVFVFVSISTIQNRVSFFTGIMRLSRIIPSQLMSVLRDKNKLRIRQESRLLLMTAALNRSQSQQNQ